MIKFLNVRGPNGAGKTTLLRCLARSPECRLVPVHQPLHLATDKGVKPEKVGQPKGKPRCGSELFGAAKALRSPDFKKIVEPTQPEEDGGERKIIPITQID